MADNDNTNGGVDHAAASKAAERDTLFGDELVKALDAHFRDNTDETRRTLYAALVGRCASMAASAVVPLYERVRQLEARHAD